MAEPQPPLGRSEWTDLPASARPPVASGTAVVFAAVVVALYFGREIFVPLALATLLSFLLVPVVMLLRRLHLGRMPSAIVAVLLAFVVIGGIGFFVGGQVAQLAQNLPQYQSTIKNKLSAFRGQTGANSVVGKASTIIEDLRNQVTQDPSSHAPPKSLSGPVTDPVPVEIRPARLSPLELLRNVAWPLIQPLATTGIVIIFVLFILLQREDLRDRFIRLVGARDLQRTTQALDDGVRRLSRYFLMQVAINATFGVLIGGGLYFIGVPNPLLWGIIAALLRFVPYIGAPMAAVLPLIVGMAVDPGWGMPLKTLALFLVVEPLIGQAVEPALYSHSTGLSAVAVVIAAAFWTWLWGPVGLLLSTPLTLCLVVLGHHVEHLKFLDVLLGDQPALRPEESFYQRMLANDPDDAAHQAEQFLKENALAAYYDEVAVKGLALAQHDINRGALSQDRRLLIKEAVDGVIDNLADHKDKNGAPSDDKPDVPPAPELIPDGAVLCVAGRGVLDEAAAAMLAQLLARRGIGARVAAATAVSAGQVLQLDLSGVRLICLSYLEAGGLSNARFVARRLRRKAPHAKILLGLWTLDDAECTRRDILNETAVDIVVTSLRDAVDRVLADAAQ